MTTNQEDIEVPALDANLNNLNIIKIQNGSGKVIQEGDLVYVIYAGFLPDGTMFDTNFNKKPFGFILGKGQVIKGWEEAIKGLKEGDEVIIDIPSEKAYGEKGVSIQDQQIIPPNMPLRFDVLIVKVIDKQELQEMLEKQSQKEQ